MKTFKLIILSSLLVAGQALAVTSQGKHDHMTTPKADLVSADGPACDEEADGLDAFIKQQLNESLCRDSLYPQGVYGPESVESYCHCLDVELSGFPIDLETLNWLQNGFDNLINDKIKVAKETEIFRFQKSIEKFQIEQTMKALDFNLTSDHAKCDAEAFAKIPEDLQSNGVCTSADFEEMSKRFVKLGLGSKSEYDRFYSNANQGTKTKGKSYFTSRMQGQISALTKQEQLILGKLEELIFEGFTGEGVDTAAADQKILEELNVKFKDHTLFKNYKVKLHTQMKDGKEVRTIILDSPTDMTSTKLYQGGRISMMDGDNAVKYTENLASHLANEVISKLPEVNAAITSQQTSCSDFKKQLTSYCAKNTKKEHEDQYLYILSSPGRELPHIKDDANKAVTIRDINVLGALQCYALDNNNTSAFTSAAKEFLKTSKDFSRPIDSANVAEALREDIFPYTLEGFLSESNEDAKQRVDDEKKAQQNRLERERKEQLDSARRIAKLTGIGETSDSSSRSKSHDFLSNDFSEDKSTMRNMSISATAPLQKAVADAPQAAQALQPQVSATTSPSYSFANSLGSSKKSSDKKESSKVEAPQKDYRDDMITSMQRRLDRMMGLDDSPADEKVASTKSKKTSSDYKTQKDIKALKDEIQRLKDEKEDSEVATVAPKLDRAPASTQAKGPVFKSGAGSSAYSSDSRSQAPQTQTASGAQSAMSSGSSASSTPSASSGSSSISSAGDSSSKSKSSGGSGSSAGGMKSIGAGGSTGLQLTGESVGEGDNRIVISSDEFKGNDQEYAAKLYAESNGQPIYVTQKGKDGKEVVLVYQAVKTKAGKIKLVAVKKIKDKKKIKSIRSRKRMSVEELNKQLKAGLGEKR